MGIRVFHNRDRSTLPINLVRAYIAHNQQTYYVTLDISKADFITRQDSSVPSGRGGNKERVLSDIFARKYDDDDLPTPNPKKVYGGSNADGESRAQQNKSQEKEPEDQIDLNEFQILELHSESPLVAYRGRVYEGNWARNIGTEMLFTRRDEDNPMPALRQLEKGVDLLAASSARILLTEKSLKPAGAKAHRRQPKVRFDEVDDNLGTDSYPTVPDPEPGASAERYAQGDFLAKLIALKKRKGETDEVTVIARLHDEGKKKAGQKKPKVEDGTPRPTRGRGSGQGRGGGRPRGRGRAKGRGVARARTTLLGEDSTGSDPSIRASTAMDEDDAQFTPERWSRQDVNDREEDQNESQNESSEDNDVDEMDVDGEYRQ